MPVRFDLRAALDIEEVADLAVNGTTFYPRPPSRPGLPDWLDEGARVVYASEVRHGARLLVFWAERSLRALSIFADERRREIHVAEGTISPKRWRQAVEDFEKRQGRSLASAVWEFGREPVSIW
jgi:hypothetical protein